MASAVPGQMRRPLRAAKALHDVPVVRAFGATTAGLERVPDVAADALPAVALLRLPLAHRAPNAAVARVEACVAHDPGDVVRTGATTRAHASLAETTAIHARFVAAGPAPIERRERARELALALALALELALWRDSAVPGPARSSAWRRPRCRALRSCSCSRSRPSSSSGERGEQPTLPDREGLVRGPTRAATVRRPSPALRHRASGARPGSSDRSRSSRR